MKNRLRRANRKQNYAIPIAPIDSNVPTPRTALRQKEELTDLKNKVLELEQQLQQKPQLGSNFPNGLLKHNKVLGNMLERVNLDDDEEVQLRNIATAPQKRGRRKKLWEKPAEVATETPPKTDVEERHSTEDQVPSSFTCKSASVSAVPVLLSLKNSEDGHETVPTNTQVVESAISHKRLISTKLVVDTDSSMTASVSDAQTMYNIIRKLHEQSFITEDQAGILKKFVDAEIADVIKTLILVNESKTKDEIKNELNLLFDRGSPSKLKAKLASPRAISPTNVKYPLQKIAYGLRHIGKQNSGHEVVVLVSSGAYNPIHMLHIRAFYLARQYIEANSKYSVVGGIISPTHDTFVRTKTRRTPRHLIPSRHRLAMLEAATATSSWLEVDKWEITRRRVLDYLSTLSHVREICEAQFPAFKFRVMYVCGCNTVVKLNHNILRTEGFGVVVVCRPNQIDMLLKHLGAKWSKVAYVVEDQGVLSCELNQATSFQVRKILVANGPVKGMVGMHVANYMKKFEIGDKIAGRLAWTPEDRSWREQDLPFVEYL